MSILTKKSSSEFVTKQELLMILKQMEVPETHYKMLLVETESEHDTNLKKKVKRTEGIISGDKETELTIKRAKTSLTTKVKTSTIGM